MINSFEFFSWSLWVHRIYRIESKQVNGNKTRKKWIGGRTNAKEARPIVKLHKLSPKNRPTKCFVDERLASNICLHTKIYCSSTSIYWDMTLNYKLSAILITFLTITPKQQSLDYKPWDKMKATHSVHHFFLLATFLFWGCFGLW